MVQVQQLIEARRFFIKGMMPFQPILDTISLNARIQYPSKVMGSRGGSPWKLADFFKNLESEEMPSLAILYTYQPSCPYPVS